MQYHEMSLYLFTKQRKENALNFFIVAIDWILFFPPNIVYDYILFSFMRLIESNYYSITLIYTRQLYLKKKTKQIYKCPLKKFDWTSSPLYFGVEKKKYMCSGHKCSSSFLQQKVWKISKYSKWNLESHVVCFTTKTKRLKRNNIVFCSIISISCAIMHFRIYAIRFQIVHLFNSFCYI